MRLAREPAQHEVRQTPDAQGRGMRGPDAEVHEEVPHGKTLPTRTGSDTPSSGACLERGKFAARARPAPAGHRQGHGKAGPASGAMP
ncbi:hypothetical protein GCM10009751_27890 [Myceligenerans crystallogenes]|uniref:Uncharacterized protein n=1 Tax=Myceligenerans crystallogenes TaxID=316335 RepID=A0ABN2NI77_9MICO